MLNPLLDKEFLIQLDENRNKETYARITSLTFDELPLEYIEGKVLSGSINVDGTSAIRRTCSLSLVTENVNISNVYWGLSTKMKLEIGIQNSINPKYPDIIWFPQGIYIITNFSTNLATNNCTISVSGKDKGCLLNGDIGGQLFASVDFGRREEDVNVYEKYTLSKSIYTAGFFYITLEDFKKYYLTNTVQTILGTNIPTDKQIIARLGLVAHETKTGSGKWYILDTGGGWICPEVWDSSMAVSESEFGELHAADVGYWVNNQSNPENCVGFNPFIHYYQRYTSVEYVDLELQDIIKESVHAYAKEPFHNIIVNDLDDYGLELLQYNGDIDVYLVREPEDSGNTGYSWRFLVDGDKECYTEDGTPYQLKDFSDASKPLKQYDRVYDFLNQDATKVRFVQSTSGQASPKYFNVSVVKTGGTIGYRLTPLTYAGELITSIGDTLATMLDKIKNMLGDYEYFYDVEGHFVFQRKKTFVNTSWNSLTRINDRIIAEPASQTSAVTYNFEGNYLLSAIQNTPALNNLKNDYSIWGKRKGLSGEDLPIHLRYAIQKKPYYYKSPYKPKIFVSSEYAPVKTVKEEAVQQIKSRAELRNFTFQYQDDIPDNFVKPTIDPTTGEISPGWWDIRDFYNYYAEVVNNPDWTTGTMKWYSTNDFSGCYPYKDIVGNESINYCWLLGLRRYRTTILDGITTFSAEVDGQERRYYVETTHGSAPLDDTSQNETYYIDVYDDTTESYKQYATKIKKNFIKPYSMCSQNHTYRYFLDRIGPDSNYDYATYLFYNPQFPFEEAIEATQENSNLSELEESLAVIADGATLDGEPYIVELVDWREILYQMAIDYFKHNNDETDDFLFKVMEANKITDTVVPSRQIYLYPGGYTGYESYYTDIQGFWRQLYCPPYDWNNLGLRFEIVSGEHKDVAEKINEDENDESYVIKNKYFPMQIGSAYSNFYLPAVMKQALVDESQINQEGQTIFDNAYFESLSLIHADYIQKLRALYQYHGKFKNEVEKAIFLNTYFRNDYKYWRIEAVQDPAKLNFWIDFLDTGELAQFDVQLVGARQKVVNDDKVTSIYLPEVPNLIFHKPGETITDRKTGYTYVNLSNNLGNMFTISTQGKSAKDKLDELLYEFSYCIENVTITSIPIYYLQPNTRVFVYDKDTNINGEYIVTRFSLPLNYNGTMQITANKAPERIY